MKILVICQYFHPEQFRVNDICFELAKSGYELTVLTGLPNYPSGVVDRKYRGFRNRKEVINGVQVFRSWLIGRGNNKISLALNYISFALSAIIKTFSFKKNFDLILIYQLSPITMALPGIMLKKMIKKPLVLYCHDLWPESIASAGISSNSKIYSLVYKLSRWIYMQSDEIFTSSKMFEQYFREVLEIQKPITHLPVYAESLFESVVMKKKDAQECNLLFAGNIGEMQNVETILYAANELKNEPYIKFHIVGGGSSLNKCEELCGRLGIKNVFFYGQHPVNEMPRFYAMADAFLITLKANKVISYTLPNKVQSYMAAGKPIIGAINGETQSLIKEAKCGLCGAAEDYKELAANIRKFVEEKEMQPIYGQNARKYYDNHFSKQIFMQRLKELLKNSSNWEV
ncbi:glycosyltransferase family 4 protein [Paenibacillus flagellatus]|uniref:Glycosyltransferase WbuB n=1 Tax=Paenibacillus flagellatus TaxID=2211139 RepID=A0A2V5K4V5_9BACL|nr:glycosyltransferase family 4 protein [Paenibacillus flagellatus]PYI52934.1 glycosyltransferase WbuB [Paenibacillus flagellatus]